MGLCRSASGSHPAPVPRCCGGAARRKGVRPCRVVMSVSARAPSSGQAARSAFRKVAATDTERARERRKQRRDWPALSPVHGGGKGRASLSGFRSMAGSSPAQRTVWTNPALWSATNQENFCFLRAGAGDGAAVLYGGRRAGAGQFPHGGGKSPMGWFGERREKRPRRGESPGVRGKGQYGYPRTGRDAASGRGAKGPCLVGGCAGRQHAGKGDVLRMCCSEALQSIGMSRADGSLHTCNDWGPCRRLQKLFPQ